VPCFDCAWSSWAYWITDNGMVIGQSENNEIDPLTGAPAVYAVAWKAGQIVNLGTLGGNQSTAAAANRRGDVVGVALNSSVEPFPNRWPYLGFLFLGNGTQAHAVLWRNGRMRDLETLGGPSSIALFVNEDGLVELGCEADRRRVLEVRPAGLDHRPEFLLLGRQGGMEPFERGEQLLLDRDGRR
jgi:uncharacterized membrane protein